jgi:FAD dependent oxidoreductase TIGR03364
MLWPIGQPAGEVRQMALRSRYIWLSILNSSGLWHERTGSLHLAYREDEAQVLEEFVRSSDGIACGCELLTPESVSERSEAVRPEGLMAGMWSPTEICIDPREVLEKLPSWLAREYGVQFEFGTTVTRFESPHLLAGGGEWQANHLYVCCGDDFSTLFPEIFREGRMRRCKLQMMRTRPIQNDWRLGPMLAGGLSLRWYSAFQCCPSLPILQKRIARESGEYDDFGIHVMVCQNGKGELTIGDSHEYGDRIEPFDKAEIEELILRYLNTFLKAPELRIASHWHGTYAKHLADPYFLSHAGPDVTLVTGVGGAGMTLSFGLAELVVNQTLGSE